MKIDIDLQVEGATEEQIQKYKEIFSILLRKGALDGIQAGSVNIHFDQNYVFQGIEFQYFPWKRKRELASN